MKSALGVALAAALLAGCTGGRIPGYGTANEKPKGLGKVSVASYAGDADDLLTAGLGKTGLGAAAPAIANPAAPTATELRRLAIHGNYRALVDVSPKGGYGTLYGPNVDPAGRDTLGEGKVPGKEYVGYFDDGTGRRNVTALVQIPDGWNRSRPCIVTATSSGSRGVYGAIGTAGEWGLKRRCAVAYTDKGTGSGVHDLATDTVNLQDGTRSRAADAGAQSNFTATGGGNAAWLAANPFRVAVKHAHSGRNPEKDWGADTLDAVRFAIWALNEEAGERNAEGRTRRVYGPDNTLVIASSVSNGGAAAIAAAEQDEEGLIDGVAVGEPVLELGPVPGLAILRGSTVQGSGRPLYDYFTLANLYQPCASQSARAANPFGVAAVLPAAAIAGNRCAALKARGLLTASTPAAQADEALDRLIAAGWQPESNAVHASHYMLATLSVTTSYANAYSRAGVADDLCGYSFAGTDATGKPAPLAAAALAQVFGNGNGVPPTAGIAIIHNGSAAGPLNTFASVSSSTGVQDYNVDGAVCQRNLWSGTDDAARRLQAGVKETLRSGNLRGKPAIIVAGRSDTLVPVNFNARPYYGLNRQVERGASRLSYVEVTNAQHFDAFIDNPALPGYDAAFVPLHVYFLRAMDAMWATLTEGAPLPPSQVVRTVPRGGTPGSAPAITASNVPPILASPAAADRIVYSDGTLRIPD